MEKGALKEAAKVLAATRRGVALTGAGVSVESGIPDFRSAGGLWTRYPPERYATIDAFRRDPARVWRMLAEMEQVLNHAAPNPGHHALASLEKLGLIDATITQNIDGLHQSAGSERVVEFHGSHRTLSCLSCGQGYRDEELGQARPPECNCGELLKPDVILFGEMIPSQALDDAHQFATGCRVMLVAGTSAEVAPASQMPPLAQRSGATVIEVNVERTNLTDYCTDIFLEGRSGEVLPALVDEVQKLTG